MLCFFLVFYLTCSPIVFGFAAILPRFMFSLFLLSFSVMLRFFLVFCFCCVFPSYLFSCVFLVFCFAAFFLRVLSSLFLRSFQFFSPSFHWAFIFFLHEICTPNCFRLTNPFTVYSCTPDWHVKVFSKIASISRRYLLIKIPKHIEKIYSKIILRFGQKN